MKIARKRPHFQCFLTPLLGLFCAFLTSFSPTLSGATNPPAAKANCLTAMSARPEEDAAFKRLSRDQLERMREMYSRAQVYLGHMLMNRALMNPDPRLTNFKLDGVYVDLDEPNAGPIGTSNLTDRQIFDTRDSWHVFYVMRERAAADQLPYIIGAMTSGAEPGSAIRPPEGIERPGEWSRLLVSIDDYPYLMSRASQDPVFGEERAKLIRPTGMPDVRVSPARQIFEHAHREVFFAMAPPNLWVPWLKDSPREIHELAQKIFDKRGEVSPLIFVSGREKPGFFNLGADGQHRLAKTGDKPGSPIYINSDLIEVYDEAGRPKFGLAEAMGIIAHELGHHHGRKDSPERELDRFGAQLANHVRQNSEEAELKTSAGKTIRVSIHRPRKADPENQFFSPRFTHGIRSRVLLSDAAGIYDLTPGIRQMILLKVREQFADIEYIWTRPFTQFSLSNLRVERDPDDQPSPRGGLLAHFLKADVDVFFLGKKIGTQHAKTSLTLRIVSDASGVRVRYEPEVMGQLGPLMRSRRPGASETAKLVDIDTNATALKAGDTWKVRASLELPHDYVVADIDAVISSPQFKRTNLLSGSPLVVPAGISAEGARHIVTFNFAVPERSISRDYQIEEIRVRYGDGTADVLRPTFLQTVRVTGAPGAVNPRLLHASMSGGKIQGLPPGFGGFNVFPWNSTPLLKFEIKDAGAIKELKILTGDVSGSGGLSRWSSAEVDLLNKSDKLVRSVRIEKKDAETTVVWVEIEVSNATVGAQATQLRLQQLYMRDDRLGEVSATLGDNFVIFRERD